MRLFPNLQELVFDGEQVSEDGLAAIAGADHLISLASSFSGYGGEQIEEFLCANGGQFRRVCSQ